MPRPLRPPTSIPLRRLAPQVAGSLHSAPLFVGPRVRHRIVAAVVVRPRSFPIRFEVPVPRVIVPPSAADAAAASSPTLVVAIDGPSGAGKSTVARQLAAKLGFAFLDTGAMYRAITWHFLQLGCAPAECAAEADGGQSRMRAALGGARLRLEQGRQILNDRDVSAHLRTREVESQVSAVSALPFVRAAMRDLQRQVASAGPVVAEGRDMGTVVFPRARWKIFLDAAPSERARRRSADFVRQGRQISEEDVLAEIEVRDRLDSTRGDAPLRQAEDALYVDSTGLTTDAVVLRLFEFVRADAAAAGAVAGGRA